MKQSSIEPSKKKLKQARLPFQILSPGVKNPVATSPQKRKRNSSDTPLDGDVLISETADVKENQVTQLEKKSKVVNDETEREVSGESITKEGNKDEDEVMEVESEKTVEAKKPVCSKSTVTPRCSNKKGKTVSSSKGKKGEKKNVITGKKSKKINTETEAGNNKTEVVAVIDLCESPCKSDIKNEKSPVSPVVVKYKAETSTANTEKTDEVHAENDAHRAETSTANTEKTDEVYIDDDAQETKQVSKAGDNNKSTLNLTVLEKNNENKAEQLKTKNDETCLTAEKLRTEADEQEDKKSTTSEDLCVKQTPRKAEIKSSKTDDMNSPTNVKKEESKVKSYIKTNEETPSEKESKLDISSLDSNNTPIKSSQSSADSSPLGTPSSLNDSVTSINMSSLNCSLSSVKEAAKSPLTTPRRMTPKQQMKLKEREEKMKERERLKQEKEKKREEEKQERLRQKQEKEEERLKLKQEKEEEKRKEKEEKERKKQAELEQKNEEKRLREEEKRLKEEEKRAKEEEKKKKEEEDRKKKEDKRLKEELKEAEKRKSAQAFVSFFVKAENKNAANADEDKENAPVESNFQPFEVKNDMRLAPLLRIQLSDERKQVLETAINDVADSQVKRLYLEEVHCPSYSKGSASKTWPAPDDTDDDVMIIESEKPNGEMEIDSEEIAQKSEKKRQRAKLLQFHENRRPPYWGTWRKQSKFIRPRAPLNQDKTMFEYDVDSDDEWEEPEDGESLRGSEDEESQDEQYEEDNDMFVPHGYLSDEEGQDELDDKSPEAMKAKLKFLQMEFEAERNEKQEKLKPRLIGCVWFCNSESDSSGVGSYIADLFLSRRAVWEGSLPVTIATPLPSSPSTPTDTETEETRGRKRNFVHESTIPHIIRKVHGSRIKLSKVLNELLEGEYEPGMKPSKRCLADKIREFTTWTNCSETGRHCWFVKEEVRHAYGLMDLNIKPLTAPPPTTPSTNITKFTKVLTSDERLKLLRELPTGSGSPSFKSSPSSTPSVPNTKQSAPSVKTQSIKLTPVAKTSSSVKKRVPLLVSVARGHQIPKLNPSSIMNFIQPLTTNQTKSEESAKITQTVNGPPQIGEKVKKRITPITLTTAVSKPTSPSKSEEIIVLND